MAHNHEDHNHSHALDFSHDNKRVFIVGIGLNLLFVVAEIIAGLLYNSMALLTDAGHNASDVASLALSLVAFLMAQKSSTAQYTYGYKKTTVVAAFVNAVVLLLAIGVLGYESVLRLLHPQPVQATAVSWIAALGIVVNGVSAYLFYKGKEKELNVKSAYLHLLSDALVSVGVVIAGVVMTYTHWYWLDPVAGLVIMLVILGSTWALLRDSFKLTIDAVPSGIRLEEIKDVMRKMPGVMLVEHVHVWPLSTTENALTAHIGIDENLPFEEKVSIVEKLKHELEHHNIHHSTLELIKP